ncbi:hypothetical protein CLAIMM_14350 [Cladophialophora immunda]|nr:hypothetical protein CLAIMM_14350 [Cladophialophora immunda]
MEVAGLLVSTVPPISCFKDCVDLLSYISAARSFGRDYDLLNMKLDLQRALLLQRLEHNHELVGEILASIALLLSDGECLQTRYGLRKAAASDQDDEDGQENVHQEDESEAALARHVDAKMPKLTGTLSISLLECSYGSYWPAALFAKGSTAVMALLTSAVGSMNCLQSFKICSNTCLARLKQGFPTLGFALVDSHEMDVAQLQDFGHISGEDKEPYHDRLVDSHVEFIHRPVYEFLSSPGAFTLGARQTQDDVFDENAVLTCLSFYLMMLKLKLKSISPVPTRLYLKDLAFFGRRVRLSSIGVQGKIMSRLAGGYFTMPKLRRSFSTWLFALQSSTSTFDVRDWDEFRAFTGRACSVEAGMVELVQHQDNLPGESLPSPPRFPLLYHAMSAPLLKACWDVQLPFSTLMVRYLLSLGCDPNESFTDELCRNCTPWEHWLREMQVWDIGSALENADLIEELVGAGAKGSVNSLKEKV